MARGGDVAGYAKRAIRALRSPMDRSSQHIGWMIGCHRKPKSALWMLFGHFGLLTLSSIISGFKQFCGFHWSGLVSIPVFFTFKNNVMKAADVRHFFFQRGVLDLDVAPSTAKKGVEV